MSSSRALIAEPPLLVLPSLAVAVGLNEAMVLQQLHFLANVRRPGRGGERWVEMGNADLQHTFPFFGANTLRRAVYNLRDRGLISIKPKDGRCNLYQLNYEAIELVITLPKMGTPKMGTDPAQNGEGALPKMGTDSIKEVLEVESSNKTGPVDKHQKLTRMTLEWLPSEVTQQQLLDNNVGLDFIRACLPEFRTYWSKKEPREDWEATFCWHMRKQAELRDAQATRRAITNAGASTDRTLYQPKSNPAETQQGRHPPAAQVIAAFTPANPLTAEQNLERFANVAKLLK